VAMSVNDGVGQPPMSTYGATNTEPGGGGGGGGGGDVVGLVVGVGVPPPPPQAAPLILQPVGLAEPVTMKPNVVDPPGAIVPLYVRFVAVTWVADWDMSASQYEPSVDPAARSNVTVQAVTVDAVPLAIVYLA